VSNSVFNSEEQIAIISEQHVGKFFCPKGTGSNWTVENKPKFIT